MKVTLHVDEALAQALRTESSEHAGADKVRQEAQTRGATLIAVHPKTGDPRLDGTFALQVADSASASELAASLRGINGVEAAYVVPQAERP